MKRNLEQAVICVIGLGYVGLPLAQAFSRSFKVIGFDVDESKVNQLKQQTILTNAIDSAIPTNLTITTNPEEIAKTDFIIIAVPTPLTKSKEPDLSFVKQAAKIVSHYMRKGATVILESTVYPGITEEMVKPILEESGLKCGADFKVAYSPERINPGDEEHALDIIRVILDRYMGSLPRTFEFDGRTYTPQEFSEQVLRFDPDNYVGVISTLALPFYTQGMLDVRDNWWLDSTYYNLPLDEWYRLLEKALGEGFTVSLGGDVSEPGYNGFEDAAVVPDFDIPGAFINQDSREFRMYNKTTSDDHGIHAVAVKKIEGHDWFLIKDSSRGGRWGYFEGYFFYRDDYIRLKTMFYLVHKDVLKDVMEKFDRVGLESVQPDTKD